ncbi:MAG: twin-arginine translocation signal domain-containing protein [Acidobacteriia bacterium]|nr:twin-arginine translocation signal domain-containing protein [Terriglobia bacterium]
MKDSAYTSRRDFLKRTAGTAATGSLALAQTAKGKTVSLVVDSSDSMAATAPAGWAAQELAQALTAAGIQVRRHERIDQAGASDFVILASARTFPSAPAILKSAGVSAPDVPEGLSLVPTTVSGKPAILAYGHDSRGLVYALLELSDRVRHAADPIAALSISKPVTERPANAVRSIQRLFVSDVEDKPWFYDREMWPHYLTMLAAQRFNRFNLSFGIGYDFLRQVTDAYFLFLYPFLLSVPGHNVRAVNLSDAERDRNLETLRFISEQTVARGLEFQLGIWMHGYQWAASPDANYTIDGLTAENHGPYCRDALAALLKACPAIGGVTFRIHGESGVAEGSYPFWKTVFDGIRLSGRKVEIDMHAKGLDQGMIDVALATGMPVKVSPKFWAEHMGMPYHQADIREQEMPKGRTATGLMALSAGSRSFTRYGYADFLREDRRYSLIHRIWPGTQRLLLWGDPVMAAGYSRAFRFCGSDGVELMEPLSFKGRRGSGVAGGRCAYADAALQPRWDWEKYAYSYRVWGRAIYNPETDPDGWRRYLRNRFEAAAASTEAALSHASRILPIVTTAHLPSAANNTYWPEIYTNQPMVDPRRKNPYTDTPSPKVFGNTSPLDPQLFSRINDFADELLQGERGGKYSPIEVAQWLEDLAAEAGKHLAQATTQAAGKSGPEFRRLAIDVDLQIGLGRFFAAKFRSGVLYAIHDRSGDRAALEEALKAYRGARNIWAQIADRAKSVYVPDIAVGELAWLKGHWLDRLPAIDDDIAQMELRLDSAKPASEPRVRAAILESLGRPKRDAAACSHQPPVRFRPKEPVELAVSLENGAKLTAAHLHYRHVNQAERFETAAMEPHGGEYRAVIPASYTGSPYPLQYYFELKQGPGKSWLHPGFAADLTNQPYFVVTAAVAR